MTRLRRAARRLDDDRGSLPFAMMVILVGMLLSAAVLPILGSMRATNNFSVTRVRALDAAQAGVDLAVGKIREAVSDSTGNGDPTQLPCTNAANQTTQIPLTGTVSTNSAGAPMGTYEVKIQYYTVDPVKNPTATAMYCVSGAGTYEQGSGSAVPGYAKISSTGYSPRNNQDGASSGRTLVSIYTFNVDNNNINGGILRIYPNGSETTNWCIDAGSATPNPGTPVVLQECTSPASDQQSFAYGTDLTLKLVSSINEVYNGTTYRQGLCLDVISTSSSGGVTRPNSAASIVMEPCGNTDGSVDWSQQWSFDDYSSLQASTSNSATTSGTSGSNLSGYCMSATTTQTDSRGNTTTVANHVAGAPIKLMGCDHSIISPMDAWLPSPAAGAGGAYTNPDLVNSQYVQIINFQQFGRCINDPGSNPSAGFVIVAGCKQNPNPNSVSDNQELNFYTKSTNTTSGTIAGLLMMKLGSNVYCLRSPLSTSATASDHLVDMVSCTTSSSTSSLLWTRTTPKTTRYLQVPYSQQYRFVDQVSVANTSAAPQCMSIATVNGVTGDTNYSKWSKLVTAPCDGTTAQQWNADNSVLSSSLGNTIEKSTSGN